jgi:hypothetical protein
MISPSVPRRRRSFLISLLFASCSIALAANPGRQKNGTNDDDDGPAKTDPALKGLLAKAGAYAVGYRKLCRDLVAEERMTQKEYDRKGRLKNQRSFISDYLFVSLPSNPDLTVEFRDVVSIDGKPVPRRNLGLLELFRSKSSNAFEEARRVTKESTKHNLGRERFSNMVNFCLSFLLPVFQRVIEYQSPTSENSEEGDRVILQFRELTDQTALRAVTPYGKKPIPSQGRIWLSKPDAKVLKIDFTFKREDEMNPVAGRYVSEYQLGVDNLLLPHRFEEYFYDVKEPERIVFESIATYSNFRHFSVDVRIVPDDPSVDPSQ